MIGQTLIAAALIGAAPAPAGDGAPREARVPRMAHFLDWRPDGTQGLFIQAETGRWYYARLQAECPRLANRANIRFEAAPDGDFDRYSVVRADGWRCQVACVTESGAPPNYRP